MPFLNDVINQMLLASKQRYSSVFVSFNPFLPSLTSVSLFSVMYVSFYGTFFTSWTCIAKEETSRGVSCVSSVPGNYVVRLQTALCNTVVDVTTSSQSVV